MQVYAKSGSTVNLRMYRVVEKPQRELHYETSQQNVGQKPSIWYKYGTTSMPAAIFFRIFFPENYTNMLSRSTATGILFMFQWNWGIAILPHWLRQRY